MVVVEREYRSKMGGIVDEEEKEMGKNLAWNLPALNWANHHFTNIYILKYKKGHFRKKN